MKKFFIDRTEREQAMLLVAAVLIGLVGFYQFAYVPLLDYRGEAERRHDMALSLHHEVRSGTAEAKALLAAGRKQPEQAVTIRSAVSATARGEGLTITRMQPVDDGDLNLWIDEADATLLHRWLLGLQDNHGITVAKASIRGNESKGTVRAQLMLTRGASS